MLMQPQNLGQQVRPQVHSLTERTGSGFPLIATITIFGAIIGAIFKVFSSSSDA